MRIGKGLYADMGIDRLLRRGEESTWGMGGTKLDGTPEYLCPPLTWRARAENSHFWRMQHA